MPDGGDPDDQVLFTMNQDKSPGRVSPSVPGPGRHQAPPAAFPLTAPFALALLGWKPTVKNKLGWSHVPNCADIDSAESLRLAAGMLNNLGIEVEGGVEIPASPGGPLEQFTSDDLEASLYATEPPRRWEVRRGVIISSFAQYQHLHDLHLLVKDQPELRVTIGMDYLIKPDVTIALLAEPDEVAKPFLHGVVSCKWSIRSDRVQNIRHEYGQMIRHRRGRQPHLVTLTAEPLPTRLASITRGTGEVDCTYHLAFDALSASVEQHANPEQKDAWDECVGQRRLRPYTMLAPTLARW